MSNDSIEMQKKALEITTFNEREDQLKKKAADQKLSIERLNAEKQGLAGINEAKTTAKPIVNEEPIQDILTRHLRRNAGITGHITFGIGSKMGKNGNPFVEFSTNPFGQSGGYYFIPCRIEIKQDNTIQCGTGWNRATLEVMVDAFVEKHGSDAAIHITENTSKAARQVLKDICESRNIKVADKSVTAHLSDKEEKPAESINPKR